MEDTIAAIATMIGESSVNIIRISGKKSLSIVNNIFSKDITNMKSHTIEYGFIVENSEKIDEVLVSYFKGPKSFTREDIVEINTHGGITSVNKVLELVLNKGARMAEPGEFLKRAFLNGRIDLVEAEAVADMISAKNQYARVMAIKGINKELSSKINIIKEKILSLIANIEVNIDYPEYEDAVVVTRDMVGNLINSVKSELNVLINDSEKGKIIKNGINVLIVGKPNVGKSSLLNSLIGEEKAIVTDIKGTTRDIVEGKISINGIDINFLDTAGIRKTEDEVEKIGVEKSLEKIAEADLVLFVVDSSSNYDFEDEQIFEHLKAKKVLVVYNKTDVNKLTIKKLNNFDSIFVSALNGINIEELKNKIIEMFNLNDLANNDLIYVSNTRQISILKSCKKISDDIEKAIREDYPIDMIEIDVKLLWNKLGEITGEVGEDKLLDEIFSKFCLGK